MPSKNNLSRSLSFCYATSNAIPSHTGHTFTANLAAACNIGFSPSFTDGNAHPPPAIPPSTTTPATSVRYLATSRACRHVRRFLRAPLQTVQDLVCCSHLSFNTGVRGSSCTTERHVESKGPKGPPPFVSSQERKCMMRVSAPLRMVYGMGG